MIRVAMISKWHVHAEGYAKHLKSLPDVNIKYVWDEDPARGLPWAQELGAIFEPTLHQLLEKEDLDAIIICSPTNMHPDIMTRAAQSGKHIFTEKVLAFTLKDCDRVIDAVKKSGTIFTISYPHRCMPTHLALKKAIDEGVLGKLTLMRVRNAHNGALAEWLPGYWYDPETTGGGAMMDLGAHPMYLLRWYLGKPTRIQSMFNTLTKRSVDDNAVSTIEFENGAIGVSETSLVSPMSPYLVEAYGTEGVGIIQDQTLKIRSKKYDDEGKEFHEQSLPEALPSPLDQFVASVKDGKPVLFGLEEARQLTELMQYAYQAHREGRQATFV
ncbi:MAG: Gfo/Idh/MocA family oxidoreductase [Oscillospiraceae bacterium]|jgi:predicted dehydrogenase|nr:Gfo/Idh/MocA family oxidoreductase [Oscillospiraceae bacterium]